MPAHPKRWEPILDGDTARIPLTRGLFATIDVADLHHVLGYAWRANNGNHRFYAVRHNDDRTGLIQMHRVILGLAPDSNLQGDHIDGDSLNNRRSNLRPATHSQNMANRRPNRIAASRFKGVSRNGTTWQARIGHNGMVHHIGSFPTEAEAADAYNRAAVARIGPFAHVNDVEGLA